MNILFLLFFTFSLFFSSAKACVLHAIVVETSNENNLHVKKKTIILLTNVVFFSFNMTQSHILFSFRFKISLSRSKYQLRRRNNKNSQIGKIAEKKTRSISLLIEQQMQMRVRTIPFISFLIRPAREHTCGAYKTTFSSILFFRSVLSA